VAHKTFFNIIMVDDDSSAFASHPTLVSRESIRAAWDWVNDWDIADNAYGRNMMAALRLAFAQNIPLQKGNRRCHGVYLVTAGPAEQRKEAILEYVTSAGADGNTQVHTIAYNSHDQPVVRRLLEPLAAQTHGRYSFVLDERSPRQVGRTDPDQSWSFDVHAVESRAEKEMGRELWDKAARAAGVRTDALGVTRATSSEHDRKYHILAAWMQSRTRTTMQRLLAEDLVATPGNTLMHKEASSLSKGITTETLVSGEDIELLFSEVSDLDLFRRFEEERDCDTKGIELNRFLGGDCDRKGNGLCF
jgi:hypothetical protein